MGGGPLLGEIWGAGFFDGGGMVGVRHGRIRISAQGPLALS